MKRTFSIFVFSITILLSACTSDKDHLTLNEDDLLNFAIKLEEKGNYKNAFKYYLLAAKKGNSTALNNIGFFYEFGQGVDKDYSKALKYYNKSIRIDNNSTALHNLSRLYLLGLGVKKDRKKALFFLNKSAELGNKHALNDVYWLTHPKSGS
ncbi:tetratricopeptide repeat protein [Xenorhabdus sp. TH1]|uniref:tetratricopeptide repeat protein n=1 Tax=Xenorhabdus sp. TH1 TaxID=3130166 RepID=UPI0030D16315